MRTPYLIALPLSLSLVAHAQVIEATTAAGDAVRLFADGHWEFVDPAKRATQAAPMRAQALRDAATQGGLFGIGRELRPGDPDYNRGSLNPKLR
ncbi:MAG: hypothetical protein AMXMBFR6_06620 [Betaproteobacteria bacterium]|nr:hypothetical protein [Rhodocyclaceae bacterium]